MKTAKEWFNERYDPIQRVIIMEEMHINKGEVFFELMDHYRDYVVNFLKQAPVSNLACHAHEKGTSCTLLPNEQHCKSCTMWY